MNASTLSESAPAFAAPKIERWSSEQPLFVCVVLAAIAIWALLAVSIIGGRTGSVVITTLLTIMVSIVAWPMFAIVEMLLYYDARVRAEGFDIEMMEAGLGELTPVEPADMGSRPERSEGI